MQHFLVPWGYVLNGEAHWAGEDPRDRGTITIRHNHVAARPEEDGFTSDALRGGSRR